MSRINYSFLILIILLGTSLRFFKLSEFPVQLNHDEVTQLYDAISIANTGKDVYGNFMPVIFHSVGDYKSPFYTYITCLFYFIFGGGELTIRLTGALFGSLMVIGVFLFTMRLFQNNLVSLISAFFTAIAPFEIFFSRKSFENVAGIFLMLLGFTFLLTFIKGHKTGSKWLYISSISFISAIYTYYSHAIILPILIIVFILIFRKQFFSRWKDYLGPAILFSVLYLPLFIMTLINPDLSYRSKTVFIKQDPILGEFIRHSLTGNAFFDQFIEAKVTMDYAFSRYLQQFNFDYIFGSGLDLTNQSPLGVGLLFLIQLPLFLLGIFYLMKQSNILQEKKFIFSWILIGMLPSGLTFEAFSPHRVIMVFTMMNIISALGFYHVFELVKDVKKTYKYLIAAIFSIVLILNLLYFFHIYFINFPYEKSQNIQYPFKQVSMFVWENYNGVDKIIVDPTFGEHAPVIGTGAYYYLAYYGNYPPSKFQKEYRFGTKEREVIFDKFSIRKVDWRSDQYLKNTLIMASSWVLPIDNISKDKIIKVFYFYDKKEAFYAIKL